MLLPRISPGYRDFCFDEVALLFVVRRQVRRRRLVDYPFDGNIGATFCVGGDLRLQRSPTPQRRQRCVEDLPVLRRSGAEGTVSY